MQRQPWRGGEDICQSQGVNSEETDRHLSGPIDFHMKSKYLHSVCAAAPWIGTVKMELLTPLSLGDLYVVCDLTIK